MCVKTNLIVVKTIRFVMTSTTLYQRNAKTCDAEKRIRVSSKMFTEIKKLANGATTQTLFPRVQFISTKPLQTLQKNNRNF